MPSSVGAVHRTSDMRRSRRPNPGNVRLAANQVALIDWDDSHADVSDLVLPDNAAGLDGGAHDIAAQASTAWEAAVCSDDEYPVSDSPKVERSDSAFDSRGPATRGQVLDGCAGEGTIRWERYQSGSNSTLPIAIVARNAGTARRPQPALISIEWRRL
ncbi:hypothetical protein [Micromonospora sp. NPDC005189]|uniref:hypothetical protein n=1 Tax=Micromonospora sp. NPDC005189 TaxID=3157019 RepID=UPI0033A399E6